MTLGKLRVASATDDWKIVWTVGNKELKIAGNKDKRITLHHLYTTFREEKYIGHTI